MQSWAAWTGVWCLMVAAAAEVSVVRNNTNDSPFLERIWAGLVEGDVDQTPLVEEMMGTVVESVGGKVPSLESTSVNVVEDEVEEDAVPLWERMWWDVMQDNLGDPLGRMMTQLKKVPIIGNIFRGSVDPLYRPVLNRLNPIQLANQRDDAGDELEVLCYGDLGCLYTTEDFYHPIHRPINLPPYPRAQIRVAYTLYTREEPDGTVVGSWEVERLADTTIRPWARTMVLIHGFLDFSEATWMLDMTRAFLQYGDVNVVCVDWRGGSRALYTQATANTRLVGLEVAYMVRTLGDLVGLPAGNVHLIGHSLGAHTAGYAGERIPGLGRITGLDPAEPYFQHLAPAVRLDPSDALFVDVIHTDTNPILALGYGLRQPVGHLDFYPNDGGAQPGCETLTRVPITAMYDGNNLLEGLDAAHKDFVACRHYRAPKFFTDSILSSCPYMAFQCPSYRHYLAGECVSCGADGTGCAPMGLDAERWPRVNDKQAVMYLSTTGGPHFCLYHYRVTVEVGDTSGEMVTLPGRLRMYVVNNDGKLLELPLTSTVTTFKPGRTYTFFVTHRQDLSNTREALVRWLYQADLFDPSTICLFCDDSFPLARITFASVDRMAQERAELGRSSYAGDEADEDVVMCHNQGQDVIRVGHGELVKIVASPACRNLTPGRANSRKEEAGEGGGRKTGEDKARYRLASKVRDRRLEFRHAVSSPKKFWQWLTSA